MHGTSLLFLEELTGVLNTLVSSVVLALYDLYMRVSNTFGSLKKSPVDTRKHPNAVFLKNTEHHSETVCGHGFVSFHSYVFIVAVKQETRSLFVFLSYV